MFYLKSKQVDLKPQILDSIPLGIVETLNYVNEPFSQKLLQFAWKYIDGSRQETFKGAVKSYVLRSQWIRKR